MGRASLDLGNIMSRQSNDPDEVERLAIHAATTAESVGDDETLARALNLQFRVAAVRGDYDRASQLGHRALGAYRRMGDSRGMCMIMNNLGSLALEQGELDDAETLLVSSLRAARSLGDPSTQGFAHSGLGWLALRRGELELSAEHLRRALDLAEEVGDPYSVLWILDKLSALATAIKTPHRAAVMLGAAQALARKMQLPYPDDLPVDVRIGSLEVDLGPAEFSRLAQMGAAMDLDAAIAYARADAPLADAT
jgi:tetratricopeptide (TPR) repeat protein